MFDVWAYDPNKSQTVFERVNWTRKLIIQAGGFPFLERQFYFL